MLELHLVTVTTRTDTKVVTVLATSPKAAVRAAKAQVPGVLTAMAYATADAMVLEVSP